ncbi:DMT family transporter [Brevibacillus sp. NRS-1366]|uniref:DMT family transporter n=1 Tax=Brevibacillus sp. NRS-1366 TaxID=3233899 RepID=UPI003D237C18
MSNLLVQNYLKSQNAFENNVNKWRRLVQRIWNSHWTADISLLLIAMIWGSNYIVIKSVVETVPVFQMLFIRFTLTAIIMLPFTFKVLRHADRSTWTSGLILGLIMVATYLLETFGLTSTSASNAGFIIGLYVVLVPVIDNLIQGRLLKISLAGILLLSITGTTLLTMKDSFDPKFGDVLVLAAAFGYAIQMIMAKKLTAGKTMDSRSLTVIQFSTVAIISGLLSLSQPFAWSNLTPSFWLATGYLVVFGTMIAYYVQLVMIRRTSPSRVALLMSSEPMFAAIFSILIVGEHLSIWQLFGGLCIITGILLGRKFQE